MIPVSAYIVYLPRILLFARQNQIVTKRCENRQGWCSSLLALQKKKGKTDMGWAPWSNVTAVLSSPFKKMSKKNRKYILHPAFVFGVAPSFREKLFDRWKLTC